MHDFQPRIVAFACNWCSYAGADLAGVSRIQYPPTTRVIRVMCSGRVSPMFVLEALRSGADGVLVTGCHLGDCHYISGNERAIQNIELAHSLIGLLGIEPQRLRLEWISAAEGARFAELVKEFTEQIRELGANPLPKGHSSKIREGATIS
ncbi:MAG: hydrogenase iron-sulfur subunit [Anaerolineae bacterium]|jgi:F420-non-reducing hydrogenase iron-sulfur subunit